MRSVYFFKRQRSSRHAKKQSAEKKEVVVYKNVEHISLWHVYRFSM